MEPAPAVWTFQEMAPPAGSDASGAIGTARSYTGLGDVAATARYGLATDPAPVCGVVDQLPVWEVALSGVRLSATGPDAAALQNAEIEGLRVLLDAESGTLLKVVGLAEPGPPIPVDEAKVRRFAMERYHCQGTVSPPDLALAQALQRLAGQGSLGQALCDSTQIVAFCGAMARNLDPERRDQARPKCIVWLGGTSVGIPASGPKGIPMVSNGSQVAALVDGTSGAVEDVVMISVPAQ